MRFQQFFKFANKLILDTLHISFQSSKFCKIDTSNQFRGSIEITSITRSEIKELQSFEVASKFNKFWSSGRHAAFRRVVDDGNYPTTPGCRVPNKQINIASPRWPGQERVAGVTLPPYHPFGLHRPGTSRRRKGVEEEKVGCSHVALVRVPVYFGECTASQKDNDAYTLASPLGFYELRH